MQNNIKKIIKDNLKKIIDLRREIHMYPETGFEEFKTTKLIIDFLNSIGIETQYACSKNVGVIATIKGTLPGKTILLRADIDALDINDETNLSYKSKISNKMHACGHDAHTATLLGVALVLSKINFNFPGKIKLLFQPAEEGPGDGGMKFIIHENKEILLDGVVGAAAFHIDGSLLENNIQLSKDNVSAHYIDFDININSSGGHCSQPHTCGDPIMMASNLVINFNNYISKCKNAFDPVVINVTSISDNTQSYGCVPSLVKMKGTIRLFNKLLVTHIKQFFINLIESQDKLYNLKTDIKFYDGYPPLINDSKLIDIFINSTKKIIPTENIKYTWGSLGSEDFSYLNEYLPCIYYKVGIKKENQDNIIHHTSKFEWDDKNLETCTLVMINFVLDWLNEK